MKIESMNDDAEDDIILQVISAHWHMIWKFTCSASNNIISSLLPGPGESFRTIMLKPGPFMMLTLLLIVFSIIIQSRNQWIRNLVMKYQNAVIGKQIPHMVTIAPDVKEGVEYQEGIAGGYAIKGRRGTMEDRHSIVQNVTIAEGKCLSFFGVYDGHGGAYVAEYMKNYMFENTLKKLRENMEKNKLNGNSVLINKIATEPPLPRSETPPMETERRESTANYSQLTAETFGVFQAKLENLIKQEESKSDETVKKRDESPNENKSDEPQTKEDPYSTVNRKKKNSKKETPKESTNEPEVSYIDKALNVNYTKLLTDQLLEIDEKVINYCKKKFDISGTTAIIAILDGELLIIGNVGDSRAVMGTLTGATTPLSVDHKPNQTKEEIRIKRAGGYVTFNGVWRVVGVLATSRAVGDFILKDPKNLVTAEPDVLTFSLKEHKADFVILATDGVWDVMSNEDAVAHVAKHITDNDFGAKALVNEAYGRGSQDNITAVVLNIKKLRL